MPGIPKFGGGASDTVLHPLVLAALVIAAVLIFVLPRRRVIIPVFVMAFLVPEGQQLYIGGVHLFVLRLVILVGLIRALASAQGKYFGGGWNRIDTAFTVCILTQAVAVTLSYQDSAAVINQIGFVWDYLGGYLLLRSLIQEEADVLRSIRCLAVLAVIIAVPMVIEQVKMVDVFGLLGGGVRLVPELREGRIRSQGPFVHSLLAGTVGAMLLPWFVGLWKSRRESKFMVLLGMIGATVMTLTANSSTPLLTYAAGVLGIIAWPIRRSLRLVRWGIVGALVGLAIVMKAPVWFVIAHMELTGGSSGYHRAMLVDQFIRHFGDWWLMGTKDVANWGWDMWDVQNQYVNIGYAGGIVAFACFLAVISWSFSRLGKARKMATDDRSQWLLWCLGASLLANVVAFFGINYFDQSHIAWFALLAMISAQTAHVARARRMARAEAQSQAPGPELVPAQDSAAADVFLVSDRS